MRTKPPHEPSDKDRKTVESMASYGIRHEDIATVIGIDDKTLRKHYRRELETAAAEANARVAESLFKQATRKTDPSVPAMIFWLKVRAGWTEKSALEIVSKMSDEELEAKAVELLSRGKGTAQ